jgi:Fe(3+) dicitrate transport protein
VYLLPPVQVSGDWLGELSPAVVERHPGARDVLREEDIENAAGQTVREVIRRIPGIQVPENNGTGSGDFALNLGIRGLPARLTSQATVLLDGVPLANAPYGQPETSLAPVLLGNLKAIDVVKGGSAVRYGPQNVGGVINFHTKDIPEDFGAELELRGDTGFATKSEDDRRASGSLMIGGEIAPDLGLALLYAGDHGTGFRENARQDLDDAILKYNYELTDRSRVSGRVHLYDADAALPGSLTQAQYEADPFQSTHSFEGFRGSREEATLKYTNEFDGDQEFETQLFYTNSFREFTLANGDDASLTRLDRLPRSYEVIGIEPRYSKWMQTGPLDHEWSVGYRFVYEETNEKRFRRSGFGMGGNPHSVGEVRIRDTDGTTRAHAAYIDDRIAYGPLSVTPGVRLERVDVRRENNLDGFVDSEDYLEVLPSLSIGYEATPSLFLYGNYNRSFASVTHLSLGTSSSLSTELKPERADIYELGARFAKGGATLQGTFFYIDFDNQIEFDASAGRNVNKGATLHRGFEVKAEYVFGQHVPALDGLSVYATYAYTKATRQEGPNEGNDLPLYSRHVGNVGATYGIGDWTLNLNGYAQSDQFADDENTEAASADGKTGEIPGFVIWDAQLSYDLEAPGAYPLTLTAGVKNIFDERYFTRASVENNGGLFVGTPRTVFVKARIAF